jgi:hypothetical protein
LVLKKWQHTDSVWSASGCKSDVGSELELEAKTDESSDPVPAVRVIVGESDGRED